MRTTIAIFAVCFAALACLMLGALTFPTVHAAPAPRAEVAPVPPLDVPPPAVDLPAPVVLNVRPITIVGHVPAKHAAPVRVKRWTCGPVYDNAVGGRNADCYWR
jgi:hypothetical protein